MKIPRILFAAGSSGSGKTLITCGFLQVLVNRQKKVASFKCGPDYIDPMFHSRVIGTKSRNLDTFFTSRELTRYLLEMNGADCDIAVMEGVMGYYDGVGGNTSQASAYDLADTTDTPVILIVNSKGMSVSLAAYVKGFLEYKKNSHIKGVIFNQMSPMLYPRMKALVEESLPVRVLGYVPKVEDCTIESRHLGLILPEEISGLQEKLLRLSKILEETLDIEGILSLAEEAVDLSVAKIPEEENEAFSYHTEYPLRIGVAKDEAFCFFYEDNFQLLRKMGAELVWFSPVHDQKLPENLDGMLLYGGYPELYTKELEANEEMRHSINTAIKGGMPCLAECGGFLYLHEELEDMEGGVHKMAEIFPGKAYRTSKLGRFGYIHLSQQKNVLGKENMGKIPAHEFHYFDSPNCGNDFYAQKPGSMRGWNCIHGNQRLMAGFPHFYYYGNPEVAKAFLMQCSEYSGGRTK